MIPVPSGVRVWLAVGRTDMRKGMNGLALQVSTDVRKWTLFDIENWTPWVKQRCSESRSVGLVQVVHRRDPRIVQRPPRVWRSDAREVPVYPPGQACGHA